jgi:TIR domain-containing protein
MVRNADVVITCDESDARWAEKLWRDLRTAGFDVVLANADVDAISAIKSAQHLVLLWSRHAAQSERVTIQRQAFVEAYGRDLSEHLLIQVWLDETTLPYPELQAVSGLRDANAYRQGPDAIEPLVWSDAVRQITTALRSKTHDVAPDRSEQSPPASSKSAPPLPPTSSRARPKSAPVPNARVRPQSSREEPSVDDRTGNEEPTDYATDTDAQRQNRAPQTVSQAATPQAEPTKAVEERVAAHADNPALVDELGRRPFAEVIAQRIDEVHRAAQPATSQDAGAFVINLHGPWGSGKTSAEY